MYSNFFSFCAIVQEKEANCMELNVREEKLKGLFKQFQVEHNEIVRQYLLIIMMKI